MPWGEVSGRVTVQAGETFKLGDWKEFNIRTLYKNEDRKIGMPQSQQQQRAGTPWDLKRPGLKMVTRAQREVVAWLEGHKQPAGTHQGGTWGEKYPDSSLLLPSALLSSFHNDQQEGKEHPLQSASLGESGLKRQS